MQAVPDGLGKSLVTILRNAAKGCDPNCDPVYIELGSHDPSLPASRVPIGALPNAPPAAPAAPFARHVARVEKNERRCPGVYCDTRVELLGV